MTRRSKEAIVLVVAVVILGVSLFSMLKKTGKTAPAPTPQQKAAATAEERGRAGKEKEKEATAAGKAEEAAVECATGVTRDPFAAAGGEAASETAPPKTSESAAGPAQGTPPGAAPPPAASPAQAPSPARPPAGTGGESGPALTLAGIIIGQPSVAVIYSGDQRRYARVGDRVGDYRVQAIGRQEVVLQGPTGKLILRMGGR